MPTFLRGFLLGLLSSIVLSGGISYYAISNLQRESAAIGRELEREQRASAELVNSISGAIADCIKREQEAQGLFAKNAILLDELGRIISILPDGK